MPFFRVLFLSAMGSISNAPPSQSPIDKLKSLSDLEGTALVYKAFRSIGPSTHHLSLATFMPRMLDNGCRWPVSIVSGGSQLASRWNIVGEILSMLYSTLEAFSIVDTWSCIFGHFNNSIGLVYDLDSFTIFRIHFIMFSSFSSYHNLDY